MADEVKVYGPKVFVYGTLKKGHGNHRLLRGSQQLGRCYVEGPFKLHDLGAFPAVVRAEEVGRVFGEVYLINTEVLASLDLLEGYPTFYTREKVATPHGKAWMYYLNPRSMRHDQRLPEIEGGVWRPSVDEREWAQGINNVG